MDSPNSNYFWLTLLYISENIGFYIDNIYSSVHIYVDISM